MVIPQPENIAGGLRPNCFDTPAATSVNDNLIRAIRIDTINGSTVIPELRTKSTCNKNGIGVNYTFSFIFNDTKIFLICIYFTCYKNHGSCQDLHTFSSKLYKKKL